LPGINYSEFIFLKKIAKNSIMIPIKIETEAISHTSTFGSKIITIPTIIKIRPGTISIYPDPGFFAIPLHMDAIGHISTLLMITPPLKY
jgi:hypothetical protein